MLFFLADKCLEKIQRKEGYTMTKLEQKLDSREVAEMIGKRHDNLVRDIKKYVEELGNLKIEDTEFFQGSTYKTTQNKEVPCYLVTKKGCEFIAHKLTGIKGTEFTAKYINRFHQMEEVIQNHIPQGQELLALAVIEANKVLEEQRVQIGLLQTEVNVKEQIIGELKPRADYTDKILKNTGLVTMTQIAKDYGMTGQAMNKLLHDLGVQYKQSGQWLLYSKYHGMGYTHSETVDIVRSDGRPDIKMNTKWTQKGRLFLYNLLKENGVVPVIEQNEVA